MGWPSGSSEPALEKPTVNGGNPAVGNAEATEEGGSLVPV